MTILSETLVNGCREIGIEITSEQIKLFEMYYKLIVETNKKLNLTSIVGEKEVATKHFIDSLTCLKVIDNNSKNIRLMDIGTGAGFPGVPLKICRREINIILVDSVEKKARFLEHVVSSLRLEKISVVCARAEEIGMNLKYREKFDWVVARAVAALAVLAEYCLPVVKEGGQFLAMKGPNVEEEIINAERSIEILGGKVERIEKLRLPVMGEERNLVLIKKILKTPEKYPRRPGIPKKRPLV